MPSVLLLRSVRLATAAALACATTITGAGVAVAGDHDHSGEPVQIHIDKSGISAPDQAEGGLVTLRVHTDDPMGRQLQLLRPHEGVSIDQVLDDLTKAISHDPATAAAGISAERDEAEALGGTFVTPQVPEEQTERIGEGPVFLLDFTAFIADPAHPVLRKLDLHGDNGRDLAPFPHSIVFQQDTAAGPRFDAQDVNEANAPILVHNKSDELHEMQIQPVKPGTTDADIQAFFDAQAKGQNPTSPFTGPPVGLSAISPNRTVEIQTKDLPAGTYVLLCFIPDDETGIPHAFEGMHKVVELH